MVAPLTENQIKSRISEQKSDIFMRRDFLTLGKPTQQKIVDILQEMAKIIDERDSANAQMYFFEKISWGEKDIERYPYVEWRDVRQQILHFCFYDSDMEGYTIVPRRIGQALTVFKSLMELEINIEDF